MKSKDMLYMNVAERSLLSVDVITQPSAGTHTAVNKIPWSSKDQWPRLIATSPPTMYHFCPQIAILWTGNTISWSR